MKTAVLPISFLSRRAAHGRRRTGRRVYHRPLAAERLENREMLSADGAGIMAGANALAACDVDTVSVVMVSPTQQVASRGGDCDQTQDRIRLRDCEPQPVAAASVLQVALPAVGAQQDTDRVRDQLQAGVKQQDRDRLCDSSQAVAAAVVTQSTPDQTRDRLQTQDRLKDSDCTPDRAQSRLRDQDRLNTSAAPVASLTASVSIASGDRDQVKDRSQLKDRAGDRDQIRARDQSCLVTPTQDGVAAALATQSTSQTKQSDQVRDQTRLHDGDCSQDRLADQARDRIHQQTLDTVFETFAGAQLY